MVSDIVSQKPPVFTSWKEIAAHFGKGVRTVQRWEATLGLPVRRPQGSSVKNIVIASQTELDTWLQTQWKPTVPRVHRAIHQFHEQEREKLRLRLEKFRELKDQNLQLQREVQDTVRNLLQTCQQLRTLRRSEPLPSNSPSHKKNGNNGSSKTAAYSKRH
jgi:nitrogen fixation/metabolism regulation signal transduction histidine kinase